MNAQSTVSYHSLTRQQSLKYFVTTSYLPQSRCRGKVDLRREDTAVEHWITILNADPPSYFR